MAKTERTEYNRTLGLFFSGNKVNLKRSMTILNAGTSIFYDNLVAEEAKEKSKQVRKRSVQRREEKQRKEEPKKSQAPVQPLPDKEITIVKRNPTVRYLWAESEPVVNSGILDRITAYDKTVQEAKFEVITSEVTYLNSLNELITRFMDNPELTQHCSKDQWKILFGLIDVVKAASELLLSDLLQHWQEDIMLTNIYSVIRQHAISILRVYREYCRKQPHAQELLCLLCKKEPWKAAMKRIEEDNSPNNSLQSYLSLPMQRVTRLPLLLEAVQARLQEGTNEFTACKLATSALKKLAKDCNESVGADEENPILRLISKGIIPRSKSETKTRPSSWTSTSSWHV